MGSGKFKFDGAKLKNILKTITIDKWLLMGAAGAVLMLCSDGCQGDNTEIDDKNVVYESQEIKEKISEISEYEDAYIKSMEDRLTEILSAVEGAGEVKVMITLKNTSTKEILKEEQYTEKSVVEEDGDGGSRDTSEKSKSYSIIYEEDGDGAATPFIISEDSPNVEGVAVVATGGDSPVVKEKITNIIKALFDIEINKIAVGKMK